MKTTGITRRIDELGRIVIPKELTSEEKALFSKLKQISRFTPRK